MNLITKNKVTEQATKATGLRVFNFGIPALETANGKSTCPYAGSCATYCYATKGAYLWSNVKPVYRKRYEATLREDFPQMIATEIKAKRVEVLRIHDAGDFYSSTYIRKWIEVCDFFPAVRFYTYTKSVPLWKRVDRIPHNLSVCYSTGGTHDHLIDREKDLHCVIFDSAQDAHDAGYPLASKNDLIASKWWNTGKKVGLIWNGKTKPKDNPRPITM